MKYDSDEKMIKNAINSISTPQYDIMLEVKKKITPSKSAVNLKKVISISLVACFCLIFSVGAMAATIPSFNNLLSIVSSDIALMLQPVNVSSIDKGIKMEVVGAMNDDEMVVIYVTMQDLTDNRIDETLDIYDYSLTGIQMLNSQIVNYDKNTKTATLRIQGNGGKRLNGNKVSFGINSFLSNKETLEGVDTGINLLDLKEVNSLQRIPLDMNNISGGGGDLFEVLKEEGKINVLKTDEMNISLPKIDFMYISNIGYIDDYLHIQTIWIGDGVDDHGYLYFVDSLGNKIDIEQSNIYFGTDELGNTQYGREYVEYIYDMKNINLNEVKLKGYFVSNKNYTTGNWKTTFKIQSTKEEMERECNIKFDTWIANKISLSPMGITLVGRGEGNNLQEITASVNMKDGSVQTLDSMRNFSEDGEIKFKMISSLPLDISMVESIAVNGTLINFN